MRDTLVAGGSARIERATLTEGECASGIDESELFASIDDLEENVTSVEVGFLEVGFVAAGADQPEGEFGTAGFKLEHDWVIGGKVEEIPVFELVEEKHDAVAGQFHGKEIGLIAFGEEAGLEDEVANAGGAVGHLKLHRDTGGIVVGAIDVQGGLRKSQGRGNWNIFRAKNKRLRQVE